MTPAREGPYRIKSITRGCTCPRPIDTINRYLDAPQTAPHIHLACDGPGGLAILGWYDEQSLRWLLDAWCVEKGCAVPGLLWLEVLPDDNPVQLTLF